MRTLPIAIGPAEPTALSRLLARLATARFLTFSFLIHAVIVVLLGSAVLFQVAPETPDFVGGSEGSMVETALPSAPPASDSSQAPEFTPPTPTLTAPPLNTLVTASLQTPTFAMASVPNAAPGVSDSMNKAIAALGAKGMAEGAGAGAGAMGRAGGMAKINFFGMKTEARRIAFLVDYSGSMAGQARRDMEEELERSLKGLPASTQILIVPWAGGAWLYDEVATEIAGKWEKIGTFDNFALRAGEKIARPEWVLVNPETVRKLMKGVLAQKSWPGGTDWRAPFKYAMQVTPPPDTIFFMSDGQIGNVERTFKEIDEALKKAPRVPKVFSLWMNNGSHTADSMKALAAKYGGEMRVVAAAKDPK